DLVALGALAGRWQRTNHRRRDGGVAERQRRQSQFRRRSTRCWRGQAKRDSGAAKRAQQGIGEMESEDVSHNRSGYREIGKSGYRKYGVRRTIDEGFKTQILRLGFPTLESTRGSPPSLRMTAYFYLLRPSTFVLRHPAFWA